MANWTKEEVELIIADYFSMLALEIADVRYNKTEHRRRLMELLPARTRPSIEFKHRNISAVLSEMGIPYIDGYKPAYNYQSFLAERLADYAQQHKEEIEPGVRMFAEKGVEFITAKDFSNMLDTPPEREEEVQQTKKARVRSPFKTNYLEREQRNARVGKVGEELAVAYERWRLQNDGMYALADKVEWIGEYDDGAGFDILSCNRDGTDRYIEVKSTKLNKEAPIFFSYNEYEFSRQHAADYHLIRFFNIDKQAKLFTLHGDFDSYCRKEVMQYKGFF